MREILFRGKLPVTGEWIYGNYVQDKEEKTYITQPLKISHKLMMVIPKTVGEYTGLQDKNGVKIFEGDVVWCRAGEHRSGVWEYEKRFVVEYGWSESMWEMSMCDEIEVIGNIHEKQLTPMLI